MVGMAGSAVRSLRSARCVGSARFVRPPAFALAAKTAMVGMAGSAVRSIRSARFVGSARSVGFSAIPAALSRLRRPDGLTHRQERPACRRAVLGLRQVPRLQRHKTGVKTTQPPHLRVCRKDRNGRDGWLSRPLPPLGQLRRLSPLRRIPRLRASFATGCHSRACRTRERPPVVWRQHLCRCRLPFRPIYPLDQIRRLRPLRRIPRLRACRKTVPGVICAPMKAGNSYSERLAAILIRKANGSRSTHKRQHE